MRVKNQLNSQISGVVSQQAGSSTVVTDKSPNDYVNQVTINVREGEDVSRESYQGSSIQGDRGGHDASQTQRSVVMLGAINQSQNQSQD